MLDWFPPLLDGTLREHYLLLFGIASGLALGTGLIGAWIGAHIGARRGVRRALREASPREIPIAVEDRLDRLADSVDTIALEVERISEAQRFAARLLAERPEPQMPIQSSRRDPGPITPH